MVIFAYMLIAAAFALIVLSFSKKEEKHTRLSRDFKKEVVVDDLEFILKKKKPALFALLFMPLNRVILNRLGRKSLTQKLHSADSKMSPEEYLGIKEFLLIALPLAVFFIRGVNDLFILALISLGGFFIPDFFLKSRTAKRKKLIIKALPEAIDLLVLCVGGGLDFMVGLRWVVERSRENPLIKEFNFVLHEIKIGRTREKTLKDMSKRLSIPEVTSFINALVHAERMGTPILDVLGDLSEEARRQRFQRGERQALQAPIKMLFPLIVFILPVVAIIVAGPILIQFLEGNLISNF